MKLCGTIAWICVWAFTGSSLVAAQARDSGESPAAEPPHKPLVITPDSGVIEDVIDARDGDYREVFYVVRWHGSRVLIESHHPDAPGASGDLLQFDVLRLHLTDHDLLQFSSLEPLPRHRAPETGSMPKFVLPQITASSSQEVVTVVESLQAVDGSYRFSGYIAEHGTTRIAVTEPLGGVARSVGEQLSVTEVRSSVGDVKTLAFVAEPRRTDTPAVSSGNQSTRPAPKGSPLVSTESGVVEEVLSPTVDGYQTHAYLVRWKGSIIGVAGETEPSRQVGEAMNFRLSRVPFPAPMEGGALMFTLAAGAPAERPQVADSGVSSTNSISMTPETGTLERVLSATEGALQYRAYVVKWHGGQVLVPDALASNPHRVGETLAFSAMRVNDATRKAITFLFFDVPCQFAGRSCPDSAAGHTVPDTASQ